MITTLIIIFAIIFFVVLWVVLGIGACDNIWQSIFLAPIGAFLLAGFAWVIVDVLWEGPRNMVKVGEFTQDIYSISRETQTKGSFCLGSGIIESELRYIYYVKNDSDGSYQIDSCEAKRARIFEKNVRPFVKTIKYGYKPDKWYRPILFNGERNVVEAITVPIGTVISKYELK